jgi:hypothetical protein
MRSKLITLCQLFLRLAAWMVVMFAPHPNVSAQIPPRPEYEIKAAFLYKFALYVAWPPNAHPDDTQPIIIGVAGENPFGDKLDNFIKNKKIQHHQIIIRYIKSPNDVPGCHILYITHSENDRLNAYLAAAKGRWILTIGDTPGMANRGVMINLMQHNAGLGFEINRTALEQAGLKASSQLLDLAQIVSPTLPP